MPIIDFIDQLSNLKKTTGEGVCHWLQMHARFTKDVVVTLDGQAKIHRSAKARKQQGKTISATVLRDQKEKIKLQLTMTEC
jgi:hypothetical protein